MGDVRQVARRHRLALVLLVLLLLSAVLPGGPFAIRARLASLLHPLALLLPEGEGGGGGDAAESLRGQLRITREELDAQRLRTAALERRVANLPDLGALAPAEPGVSRRIVPARVLCRDPNILHRTLLVDRGASDGLERGQPAIVGKSLVGIVTEVGPSSARVALIHEPGTQVRVEIHPSSAPAAGAAGAKAGEREGILTGGGTRTIRVRFVVAGNAAPGDLVATAMDSWRIPAGLLVGRVLRVDDLRRTGVGEAEVEPSADLEGLRTVYILVQKAPDARVLGKRKGRR